MDPFSYLSVLISIILALGMTRVVAGIGEMLQARQHRRIYWVHAVWVLNLFLFLVIAWWIFYRWRFVTEWTYYLFVFVLIAPTLLYLAAVVLFPPEPAQKMDYRAHYYANHRAFFILFGLWIPVDFADSLLKGSAHFATLGWPYVLSAGVLTVVFTTAAVSKNEKVHGFIALYFLFHIMVISFVFFRTLM